MMIPDPHDAMREKSIKSSGRDKGNKGRWIWPLVVIVLLALIVALGLGLGLTIRHKRQYESGESDRSSTASDSGNPSTPTAYTAPPKPTTSDIAPCPGANNTVYTSPVEGGHTRYRRICGVSYDGNDIQPQKAETMGRCLSLCSGRADCAGVVWYDAGRQGTDLNWCWLKSSMEKAVLSYRDSAQTAIRL